MLLTPPFTQLNTPYPATMYLKGFLFQQGYTDVFQVDLSIELANKIFCKNTLEKIFSFSENQKLSLNAKKILSQKRQYLQTIEPIVQFLQNQDITLAYRLSKEEFFPQASQFANKILDKKDLKNSGIIDKAKFWATKYIEDIGNLIIEVITPHFGFVKYAEKLGISANFFTSIEKALQETPNYIDTLLAELLQNHLKIYNPDVIGITIPFPGNLYAALRCCQTIKSFYPKVKIILGGGYINTELRELKEPAIFNYTDFITLDDGELPLLNILEYLEQKRSEEQLLRTYIRKENQVILIAGNSQENIPWNKRGTPNYSDIKINNYMSFLDIVNDMHRLWSDGFWNKLTLAHGCYWHKCAFCDTKLNYICEYKQNSASYIVDQIQSILQQTRKIGFHFVDEAAPPSLLQDISMEILRRELTITWWTNIRYEKSFTKDLALLMAKAGCIAVTGGIETPCDRILKKIDKGIGIQQISLVLKNFRDAGIMVHAYLMYGFPGQKVKEYINGLSVVQQLFKNNLLTSAYWHRFALSVHSPIAQDPDKFGIRIIPKEHTFAYNDLDYEDPNGDDPEPFSICLNAALQAYMSKTAYLVDLQEWFPFKIPQSNIDKNLINHFIQNEEK